MLNNGLPNGQIELLKTIEYGINDFNLNVSGPDFRRYIDFPAMELISKPAIANKIIIEYYFSDVDGADFTISAGTHKIGLVSSKDRFTISAGANFAVRQVRPVYFFQSSGLDGSTAAMATVIPVYFLIGTNPANSIFAVATAPINSDMTNITAARNTQVTCLTAPEMYFYSEFITTDDISVGHSNLKVVANIFGVTTNL